MDGLKQLPILLFYQPFPFFLNGTAAREIVFLSY